METPTKGYESNLFIQLFHEGVSLQRDKAVFPCLFWNKEDENDDPWWKFRNAIKKFNETRKEVLKVGKNLCLDESMSSLVPRTR